MPSSCQPDTETQQALTESDECIGEPVTHLKLSTAEMCRRAPDLFRNCEPPAKPSFTLDDWAARNPVAAAA